MNRRIIRVNPLREMVEMQRALDRFFEDAWRPYNGDGETAADAWNLPVDVIEREDRFVITAALPGIADDHIDVSIDDSVLTIIAELPEPILEEGERLILNERRYGRFQRNLRLNKPVDIDSIEATFDDGILTLELPLVPEVQPRKIGINRAN